MKYFKPLGVLLLGFAVILVILILTPNTGEDYILYLKAAVFMVGLICTLIFVGKAWPKDKSQ